MSIKKKIKGLLTRIIRRGYWYNNVLFPDCKKFWNYNIFNTDVINLGSTSAVNAFLYDTIPLKCANWALSTNPLRGDFAILKNYYSYLNERNATVIIPLCPFSSLSGSYSITDDRYYTLLYPSSIPAFSINRQRKILSIKNNPIASYPILDIFSSLKAFLQTKDKQMSEIQMQEDATKWMTLWKKEFSITDFSYPLSILNLDGIEDASRILNEMIEFCKDRHIRPAILIPPVYHTLGNILTQEIRELTIKPIIEKLEDKSVWFHNYMDDPLFTNDISLFRNSFLMNEKGAKLFTRQILKDIGLISD